MSGWMMRYPNRYLQEIAGIRTAYPQARVLKSPNMSKYCLTCNGRGHNENLAVIATLVTPAGHAYPVIMVYPCEFPNRLPGVWPLKALHDGTPHQFSDKRICLTGNEHDNRVTGAQMLGLAYGWFLCYDIWCKTGKFPENNYGKHRIRR